MHSQEILGDYVQPVLSEVDLFPEQGEAGMSVDLICLRLVVAMKFQELGNYAVVPAPL